MTDIELRKLIEQGEDYYVEFKRNINSDLKKEMVAFANAAGGRIFLGVEDDGSISGINITNDLLSKIQVAADDCDPRVFIKTQRIADNILLINVAEGDAKPYRSTSGFYIRSGANAQKMRTDAILEFVEKEGRVRFDDQVRKDAEYEEHFSIKKWNQFAQMAGIRKDQDPHFILRSLEAIKEIEGISYFTNMGILAFMDNPTHFLPQATVACVVYSGTEKVKIFDRKEFDEDIISNINMALKFVERHINVSAKITGLQREDIWEIPEVVLREAIVNAVVHRDYFEKGARVVVELFTDKIIISNPGGLPKGLAEKDFGKYSLARNSVLANLLLRAHLIEKLGTGIRRINDGLTDHGLSKASFDFGGFFSVTFDRSEIDVPQSEFQQEPKVELKASLQELYDFIAQNPNAKTKQISEELDRPIDTLDKQIRSLIDEGLIERRGSKKAGGYWLPGMNDELVGEKLSPELENLYDLILSNPNVKVKQISEKLNKPIDTLDKQIKKLIEEGLVERRGSKKIGGYWVIKEK